MKQCLIFLEKEYENFCVDLLKTAEEMYGAEFESYALSLRADEAPAENKFDAIITIHAPYKTVNFDGPAQTLADKISEFVGYPTSSDIGYPTPGSFGTYCGVERKIPTITIEIDENEDIEFSNKKFHKLFSYLENEF